MAFDYDWDEIASYEKAHRVRTGHECPKCDSSNTVMDSFPDFVHSRLGQYQRHCVDCGYIYEDFDRCTG